MNWKLFVEHALATSIENTKAFKAGRIKYHFDFWKSLNSDTHTLNLVLGCKIDLPEEHTQEVAPEPYYFSKQKACKVDIEQGLFVSQHFN